MSFSIRLFNRFLGKSKHTPKRLFYDWKTKSDTIFALATSIQPIKGSPLGVIRVSGPKTATVLQDLIKRVPVGKNEVTHNSGTFLKPRHATLSKVLDPRDNELLDIGLVLWFPGPNSYTGEDSCELHLHGSQAIITKLMSILGDIKGLRPAEPGEFTCRAVGNGKLDLIQAESLPELIAAQTDQQRKLALQGLVGATKDTYERWTQTLVRILAHLEASIDFGEDELIGEERVVGECIKELAWLTNEVSNFIAVTSQCRSIVRSGARAAILGPPNAGKSTLMNILCCNERSIVSDLSGTTRDVIEHTFDLGGHTLALCDTAGLKTIDDNQGVSNCDSKRQSVIERHDSIEREGIKRALDAAKQSNLIIYLVDGSQVYKEGVAAIADKLEQVLASVDPNNMKLVHLVVNKIDLMGDSHDLDELTARLRSGTLSASNLQATFISCRTNTNIETLVKSIVKSLNNLQVSELGGDRIEQIGYVNERHLALLRSMARHLKRAQTLDMRTIDEMAQHVRESVDYLSRIVGTVDNDDVIDVIFRDFCIGK